MSLQKYKLEDNEYRPQLEELVYITTRLKRLAKTILYTILLIVIFFVILGIFKRLCFDSSFFYKSDYTFFMVIGISFIVFFVSISINQLLQFNDFRKKGMILYDELTDEIDWSNKRKEFIYRPPMEMRIIIKEFIKSSDLPFTSGTNGLAFYFIILLSLVITTVLLFTL